MAMAMLGMATVVAPLAVLTLEAPLALEASKPTSAADRPPG
jgi:hypothetical protein